MTVMQPLAANQVSPEVVVNENFDTLSAAAIFGRDPETTTGLIWGYLGGLYNGNTKANGTVTLTNSADNYVVVLRSTGVVSVSTSSTNSLNSLYAKLYKLTCAGGVVTVELDQRMDANGLLFGSSGGSSTLAALTDVDIAGSPSPTNGQVLSWSSALSKWIAATVASAVSSVNGLTGAVSLALGNLTDVDVTGSPAAPTHGQVLAWSASAGKWIAHDPTPSTVTALSTSGTVNVDLSLGDYFTIALAGNVTSIVFLNLPGSGKGASKWIQFTQDSTPRTVAWPGSFKWAGGVAGAVSTGSGAIDELAITTVDNGTTWKATLSKAWA